MFDEYLAMIGITNDNVGSIIMFVAPFAIAFMFWIGVYDESPSDKTYEEMDKQRKDEEWELSSDNPKNASYYYNRDL